MRQVQRIARWSFKTIFLAAFALLAACSGEDGTLGMDQPLRVRGAQFFEGELPGEPPLSAGSEQEPTLPSTTSATSSVALLRERLAGISFSGLASPDATSVGIRFSGLGNGYWVVPTGFPDPAAGNRATWDLVADFQDSLPAGRQELLAVAFDEDGNAGTQSRTSICVRSMIPDNGNVCSPRIRPPTLVVSLSWDTPVDLDLKVVTPSGIVIDGKRPSSGTANEFGVVDPSSANAGNLDRDSNRDCVIDGLQRENIVFQRSPEPGTYLVYASLNRACGQAGVSYLASYHVRTSAGENDSGEAEYSVRDVELGAGSLVAAQASGDTTLGTFVEQFSVQ